MKNRREIKSSWAIDENLEKSINDRECQLTGDSDSSDDYEEETHISYHFRRWANHICSVSNNVTSRLRDLLGNNLSSNTASNHSVDESCEDEGNSTSWTTSSGIMESSNRTNKRDCDTRRYHQDTKNHRRITPREKDYFRYGKEFGHVTEDHRMRHETSSRMETRPNFVMGQNVATYPPVLILPRLNQRVNRQSIDTDYYQSRKHILRHRSYMHGAESADGWYRHYHHLGKRRDYEGSSHKNNYSRSSDRHQVPEEFSSSTNDPKIKNAIAKKTTRNSRGDRKIESDNYGFKSVKHFSTHISGFHSESYRNDHESTSQINDDRPSREKTSSRCCNPRNSRNNDTRQNSNHSLESTAHVEAKKVIWDLQLPDITSHEAVSRNPSMAASSAKSSATLNIEKKRTFVEQDLKTTLVSQENANVPSKDDWEKHEMIIPPENHIETHPRISHDIQGKNENDDEERNADLVNGNGMKWSSIAENSVDSLLQSLRERMDTLANIDAPDSMLTSGSIEYNMREESNSTKDCIVASCFAETYLPQCLERRNQMTVHSVAKNEEMRPSFSDRIQDIWRDGTARVWKSSPRHRTSSSKYNLKSEKDLSSKLSLLGLNQQPVLRGYFGEYNNAVTLARILEKLIDTKSKSDANHSLPSETPKPPPRFSRKQSKTCVQVSVGVQKSTPTSMTSSKDRVSYSRHRFMEKQRSRRSLRRNLKPRVPALPIEKPRPLHVFSGQSFIPISSIQVTPVIQPLSNISGFSPPSLDATSSSECLRDPSGRHGNSIIIDNPVFQAGSFGSVVDNGRKFESFFPSNDSPFPTRGMESLDGAEINRQVISEQEHILSLVLEKIEHKRQRAQRIAQNTDVSQQHSLYYSTPVPLQESRVVKDRADVPQAISTKGRSWWKKKFQFNKSSNLKRKIASLLKYLTKKHTDDGKVYVPEEMQSESIVPIPPVRVKRKCNAGGTKSSRSIQWELDKNVSHSVEKVDSFQVTEDWQSNKSTSVGPIMERVTVTSGTNTDLKKSQRTSARLSLIENRGALMSPESIQVSKEVCSDLSNELVTIDERSIEPDIVTDSKKESELMPTHEKPSSNDSILPSEEILESSTDPCQKEEVENSWESTKLKISRSSSSKIPLAIKPVNPFGTASTISEKRPSTAPILENSSSHSLRSNAFLGELEAGKSFGKECASQESGKKMLFKHNRSSLLRANNSMSKKGGTGQYICYLSRNTNEQRYIEKISIPEASMSPVQVEEKSPLNLPSVEETPSNELISREQLVYNQSDTEVNAKAESLPLKDVEASNSSETHPTSSISEQKVAEPKPFCDVSRDSVLATKDLTHNEGISNLSISSSRPEDIDSRHTSNSKADNLFGSNQSICRNLEDLKDERLSPKTSTSQLDANPDSFRGHEEKETPNVNWESKKLGDNESVMIGSTNLREGNGSPRTYSKLQCDRVQSNVNSGKDEELLPTQLKVREDPSPGSIDLKELKRIATIKTRPSNSNVCKLRSDNTNSIFIGDSAVKEQPEVFFACRVEMDKVKDALQGEAKLQPRLTRVTDGNIGKYLPKHPDVPVKRLALQKKEIYAPERPRKPCSQSKSIPSSRLSPQHGIGKSGVKSARLLRENITPFNKTVSRLNSANKGSNANVSVVSGVVDDSINRTIATPESQDLELASAHGRRRAKSSKDSKQKSTKICRTRNSHTYETFELVRDMLDLAINESLNVHRKSNSKMVNSKQSIPLHIPVDSEKSSSLSIDSLEPIQLRTPPSIGRVILPVATDEVDERYSTSCLSYGENTFGSSCSRKQLNIWFKRAQPHQGPTSVPEIISDVVTNEGQNDCQDIQSSQKFLMKSKPLRKNGTSERSTPLKTKSADDQEHESKSAVVRSEKSRGLSVKRFHPDKLKVPTPSVIEDYLTQSAITFDLAEFVDKHQKLSDTDNNVIVMDDESSGKSGSSRDSRNVKINNKVLEKKVKCSIESGVPLKKITITDPSIIKHSCLNPATERIMVNKDFQKTKSEMQDKSSKKLYNNSQDTLPDDKSEGQRSHTTWASHENRELNMDDKTLLDTPSKSENAELRTEENRAKIHGKRICAVDQHNLIPSMSRSELHKKPKKRRGTLIPRYKKIPLNSSIRNIGLRKQKDIPT